MSRTKTFRIHLSKGLPALLAVCIAAIALPSAAQPAWKPDKTVEIVVTAGPGGGNDRNARLMQKIWQEAKLLDNVVVQNKAGAGGALAYTYTNQTPGDGHRIVIARTGLISNNILGLSPLSYTDMTPIALMGFQAMSLVVRGDSGIRNVKDLVARWKTDPQSVSISLGGTRGSATHFVPALIAKAVSVDPQKLKTLTFTGASDSLVALLGGHIDMMATSLPVEPHKSGKVKVIGVATEKRSDILPDVPTMKEQGFDVVVPSWTAIVGPKGLSAAQVAYWEGMLEQIAKSESWKQDLAKEAIETVFLKSQATREFLARDHQMTRGVLVDLGMAK